MWKENDRERGRGGKEERARDSFLTNANGSSANVSA